MTDREKLARQWAEQVRRTDAEYERKGRRYSGDPMRAAAEYILATTTPTMADVEWDHEKHHLAGAVFQNAGTTAEVVMFQKDGSGAIIAVDVEDGKPFIGDASKYTPNGKRYELVEVTEPGHPEVLETLEDYENAPEGTIATRQVKGAAFIKSIGNWSVAGYTGAEPSTYMAGVPRHVLRWGWGDEA